MHADAIPPKSMDYGCQVTVCRKSAGSICHNFVTQADNGSKATALRAAQPRRRGGFREVDKNLIESEILLHTVSTDIVKQKLTAFIERPRPELAKIAVNSSHLCNLDFLS
jgi:hypothetical protein